MKKKRQHSNAQHQAARSKALEQEDKMLLKDRLNVEVLNHFKEKKEKWQAEASQQEEAARQRRLAEQKQREKNKSFEELLNESDLNWKQFK